jgi:hypothetical protein
MANLNWVRVDATLATNHKILAILSEKGGDHAVCVYVFALGYCGSQGTDGFIPSTALGLIHGKPRDSQLLVDVGLWHDIPGGYEIHDWLEFQPSSEETKARSEKAKRAAEIRWAKTKQTKLKAVN